jgi:hypothetical protein
VGPVDSPARVCELHGGYSVAKLGLVKLRGSVFGWAPAFFSWLHFEAARTDIIGNMGLGAKRTWSGTRRRNVRWPSSNAGDRAIMTRPPMEPQPDFPAPGSPGPVPPMRNPGNPPRPTPVDTPVPDPDDPTENPQPGPDQPPSRLPFPDQPI